MILYNLRLDFGMHINHPSIFDKKSIADSVNSSFITFPKLHGILELTMDLKVKIESRDFRE